MKETKRDFTIFLVEDDVWYAEILEYHLSMNPDYVIEKYNTAKACFDNMYKNPDIICLDYSLPDIDGEKVIQRLRSDYAHIPVIMISGQKDIQTAINILQNDNVHDYLVKDDDTKDRLWKGIIKVRERSLLQDEVAHLKEELGQKYDFNNVIKGNSEGIKRVFKVMQKACDNNITVSITGETGTGKELVAKCVHYNSTRSKKAFVAVNMNAIPDELIEGELFGHEKGAFTTANARRIGKFEEAHKGTLFLDEIADMDLAMQGKLLRVLQEREVTRIGSNKPIPIDVRIIVATHKDLAEEVKNGNFRQDLYYRLLGLPIEIPPLRERRDDILLMSKFFSDAFCKENKKKKKSFSQEAKSKLSKYHYPGNIRELKAVVELAVVLADEETINADDITFNNTATVTDFIAEENTMKGYIANIVSHYLKKCNNDVGAAAEKLDIGKSTIYKMIKRGEVVN